ncbi:hypothetical protein SAMN02983003_1917 [Devosia enhydra]|uniref:Uncharacterized protein n=1 Tax=Devosia enhydra TaxID=665118 RepID=A0A1K2HXA5_9HYPH|nr:hypothetical protein [Devosia enhydra]SFZ84272.1 hypothetical protein SAMN02983003_1917 [Devosia enhydra]
MSIRRQQQQRTLDADEFARVEATRHPAIADLSDKDLGDALGWLRERRDRAQQLANRQRRAVRGKSDRPAGFDQADAGNREKAAILGEAVARVNKERERRRAAAKRGDMVERARSALAARRSLGDAQHPEAGRTARKGFKPVDRTKPISPKERSFP